MKIIEFPLRTNWPEIVRRPVIDSTSLYEQVAEIIEQVRTRGDAALFEYMQRFDGIELERLMVSEEEFELAETLVSEELKAALKVAAANIECFHSAEDLTGYSLETMPGVLCSKKWLPIERVGIYIPAGSAPLFSTVLMLAIPARLAGCAEVVLCSPAGADGHLNPVTLYAARSCGVSKVFKIGGAQAVAALAYGTESVPRVYKIFGPGNQYVTEAKMQALRAGVAIDMPAGPSEVAVLCDDSADPVFVASDLLSQAEHGPDSQVLLVCTSKEFIDASLVELEKQLADLPRSATAAKALSNSAAILVSSIDEGLDLLNEYAPEHLIISTRDAHQVAAKVTNAGSVFVGPYSCESAGDYASGTNHTLPTNGAARAFSGVSVSSFMKSITFQTLTAEGISSLGPVIETMAAAEGLDAHKNAVSLRLKKIREAAN